MLVTCIDNALQRLGSWIACVEWLCFVCLHTHGAHWKADLAAAPAWVANVMRNSLLRPIASSCSSAADFKTATGVFVISGLHVLPIALFLRSRGQRLCLQRGLADDMCSGRSCV